MARGRGFVCLMCSCVIIIILPPHGSIHTRSWTNFMTAKWKHKCYHRRYHLAKFLLVIIYQYNYFSPQMTSITTFPHKWPEFHWVYLLWFVVDRSRMKYNQTIYSLLQVHSMSPCNVLEVTLCMHLQTILQKLSIIKLFPVSLTVITSTKFMNYCFNEQNHSLQ